MLSDFDVPILPSFINPEMYERLSSYFKIRIVVFSEYQKHPKFGQLLRKYDIGGITDPAYAFLSSSGNVG